jgi:rhamnogalacturonan endolyase
MPDSQSPSSDPRRHDAPRGHASRRQFLGRTAAGAFVLGTGTGLGSLVPARPAEAATAAGNSSGSGAAGRAAVSPAATAFGFTSSGGYYTVSTGAGVTFQISQSDGDMTSLTYNGTQLGASSRPSNVESGLGAGAAVSAYQTGNYIVVTESVDNWYGSGTLYHYFVVQSGVNNIYMATYVNAAGAGELRWIQSLDRTVLSDIYVPSDILDGTAIESTDIYTVDGQTRSKYYSNRQAMSLTVRGVTGSGVGVFMDFGTRESSAGGPFFRDIEQQGTDTSIQVYNYLWSAHNQTEAQRLNVLYGPYALMVTNGSVPTAPDLGFMYDFGFQGTVGPSGRGYVSGTASGVASGAQATVGFANSTAQYWATPQANGSFTSPAMKAGTYTMTLYQNELGVATSSVTVNAGATTGGQNIASGWYTPASPVFRIGTWDGAPTGFLNWPNLTWMHPSDTRNASWGPVTYTVGSSSAANFPSYQWKGVNNPTTIEFSLTGSQIQARTVRIGITAAYAGGRPQVTVNGWTSAAPSPSSQPDSRSLTIGTYRGNNTLYTYSVPASAFVAGTNTMTLTVISGSASLGGYLEPGCSYDCVELY